MEKLQNERSCFPAQDPGHCSLPGLGGLAFSRWATGLLWHIVKLQTEPFPFFSFPHLTFPWLFQSPFNTQAQLYFAVARDAGDARYRLMSPSEEC